MIGDFLLAVGVIVCALALAGWISDTSYQMRRRRRLVKRLRALNFGAMPRRPR